MKKIVLDFTFRQIMKLSNLKRWAIIEMSKSQSVAEHSYNVAMISMAIVNDIADRYPGRWDTLRYNVLNWALVHDLPELVTGDLPSPIKEHIGDAVDLLEYKLFPDYMTLRDRRKQGGEFVLAFGIVKAADYIDAIHFAEKFCVDADREKIIGEMRDRLNIHCNAFDTEHGMSLSDAVRNIWRG